MARPLTDRNVERTSSARRKSDRLQARLKPSSLNEVPKTQHQPGQVQRTRIEKLPQSIRKESRSKGRRWRFRESRLVQPVSSLGLLSPSLTEAAHHNRSLNEKVIDQSDTFEARNSVKRQRTSDGEGESRNSPERQRYNLEQHIQSGTVADGGDFVENWMNQSGRTERPVSDKKQVLEVLSNMSRKHQAALLSPKDSFGAGTTESNKSDRSTVTTHGTDYHISLGHRNIYIEREDPSPELIRRAHRIITRPRLSPEVDDGTVEKLKKTSRDLRDEAEDVIIKRLGTRLIPAIEEIPDPRLNMNAEQKWFNAVPVPLDPSILTGPPALPKPKPDVAFGFSKKAFTRDQQATIDLLVDDQFGRSYAVPDQKLRFPFLSIEFKSQAKNGTHYIATNQAAGAGAIALNGNLELTRRSFGLGSFDYDEPQFFSMTMDHEFARLNVHWVKAPAEGEPHSFHVEGLSKHLLDDKRGIRAVVKALKNILEYNADTRLRSLCEALEAYRATVIQTRETANTQARKAQPDLRGERDALNLENAISFDPSDESASSLGSRRHAQQKFTKTTAPSKRNRRAVQTNNDETTESADAPREADLTMQKHEQDYDSPRRTRSSNKTAPTEVTAVRVKRSGRPGRLFQLSGNQIFVPEAEWKKAVRSERAALVNSEYNVWCYDT